jgi:hypothetical protein
MLLLRRFRWRCCRCERQQCCICERYPRDFVAVKRREQASDRSGRDSAEADSGALYEQVRLHPLRTIMFHTRSCCVTAYTGTACSSLLPTSSPTASRHSSLLWIPLASTRFRSTAMLCRGNPPRRHHLLLLSCCYADFAAAVTRSAFECSSSS